MLNSCVCMINERYFTTNSYDRVLGYIFCSNVRALNLLPKEADSLHVGCGESVAKDFCQSFTIECCQHDRRTAF